MSLEGIYCLPFQSWRGSYPLPFWSRPRESLPHLIAARSKQIIKPIAITNVKMASMISTTLSLPDRPISGGNLHLSSDHRRQPGYTRFDLLTGRLREI